MSVQAKAILEEKRVCHVVLAEVATNTCLDFLSALSSVAEHGFAVVSDAEYARDVASLVILPGLGEVLFACMMEHQKDAREM